MPSSRFCITSRRSRWSRPSPWNSSSFFIGKITLFVLIALASIYPTLEFLSWSKSLKQGNAPSVNPARLRVIRAIIHWELAGVVLLILCAVLMARGVGYLG